MAAAQRLGHRYRVRECPGPHEIIPLPFNQARIASPTNPLCGPAAVVREPGRLSVCPVLHVRLYRSDDASLLPTTTYAANCPINCRTGSPCSSTPKAATSTARPLYRLCGRVGGVHCRGVSAYNAFQAHVEKRLSHGLQAGVSYTYSRSLDEQSALGLFYNGNNPLDLRGGYGPSDFDRTHVFNIDYHYELPKFFCGHMREGKVADGWAVQG